jgi:sorbitol-specific phosphotransferase system component IIA
LDLLKLLEQLHGQVIASVLSSTSGALEEVGHCTSFQMSSVANTGNTIRLDTTPPPDFQPRLILHQESISGFSPVGDTGNYAISGLPPAGDTG